MVFTYWQTAQLEMDKNLLILKCRTDFIRLMPPLHWMWVWSPSQILSLYVLKFLHLSLSSPSALHPGKPWPLISTATLCVKGRESWIIPQKSVPKLPHGILNNNMFKQNMQEKSKTNSHWLSIPLNTFLPVSVSSLFQRKPSLDN